MNPDMVGRLGHQHGLRVAPKPGDLRGAGSACATLVLANEGVMRAECCLVWWRLSVPADQCGEPGRPDLLSLSARWSPCRLNSRARTRLGDRTGERVHVRRFGP